MFKLNIILNVLKDEQKGSSSDGIVVFSIKLY